MSVPAPWSVRSSTRTASRVSRTRLAERGDVELQVRPRAVHVVAHPGAREWEGAFYPAAHADQVRQRPEEGDVSFDTWLDRGVLKAINVEFLNAGPTLFGVAG